MTDRARGLVEQSAHEEDLAWVTVHAYAASRGVHVQTVYSAIRRGLFSHRVERVGRSIRIAVSRGSIQGLTAMQTR